VSAAVTGPDGRTWTVRRRWVPRLGSETLWGRFTRRFRRSSSSGNDAIDATADTGMLDLFDDNVLLGVALLIGAVLFVFLGWPLLVALLDVVFIVLLALLGVIARVVFRRPWTIEARAGDDVRHWRIVGWRASEEHRRSVEARLWSGVDPGGLPADSSP
jgi:hypothetical protein